MDSNWLDDRALAVPYSSAIATSISDFDLDLRGLTVITEAATGVYACTPIIGALAGASRVVCLARDGQWGSARDAKEHVLGVAMDFDVAETLEVYDRSEVSSVDSSGPTLVTNLRGVRPISRELLRGLDPVAAVALMWPAWEFRNEDLDLTACMEQGIWVASTNERDARLRTMEQVGMLVIRLLLDLRISPVGISVAVVGDDDFSASAVATLNSLGAFPESIESGQQLHDLAARLAEFEVIVVADHKASLRHSAAWRDLLTQASNLSVPIVNLSGMPQPPAHLMPRLNLAPPRVTAPRHMSVALDYMADSPVIRLHAAGLKVGQITLGCRMAGHSAQVCDRLLRESGLSEGLL